MARRLRFIPEGGSLVEVTSRTVQARFLLKPSAELRSIVIGVLARAQGIYPVAIHAFVFMSNHYHLLLSVENARQLSQFMNYVNSNLAREAGRIHGWRERFWGRRYQAIVVSSEEAAQVGRVRYVLSHGCKEGLVSRPQDWPGANCVKALTSDQPLEGLWFDRTREYTARARGEKPRRLKYAIRLRMHLAPLPCWSHLSEDECRARFRDLVQQIEKESRRQSTRQRKPPLGMARVMEQHPYDRPRKVKKTLAPAFHAATAVARRELVDAYRWFIGAYRNAAERLRQGDRAVDFPVGSFPPSLPFVGTVMESAPG